MTWGSFNDKEEMAHDQLDKVSETLNPKP